MDKFKEILVPHIKKGDENVSNDENDASIARGLDPQIKSPLAQGHIQDAIQDTDGPTADISAPAELTGMTGQYITGRDASSISEQELKKHGTATGLASATMASGAVGEQNPSSEQRPAV